MKPYYQDDAVTIYNCDCREILPTLDKVDAVVTDPPYGLGAACHARGGTKRGSSVAHCSHYQSATWDDSPVADDLRLMVMSAAPFCIWFGGNYYPMPPTTCWLVWDKENGNNGYADCELAWTNLPIAVRRIRHLWHGMLRANGEARVGHPTQKPVNVMQWCIERIPASPALILDPFMGSGTTLVAAKRLGRRAIGIDLSEEYCEIAARRCGDMSRVDADDEPLLAMMQKGGEPCE